MCYCYLLFLLFCTIKARQSLRLCCQCIKQPGLALKVVLLWAGGWTGWPPGVPPNLLEVFLWIYQPIQKLCHLMHWHMNVITPLSSHPCLSAENHLFFLAMSLLCLCRLESTWQSEPQWPVWSPVLLMAPVLTSQARCLSWAKCSVTWLCSIICILSNLCLSALSGWDITQRANSYVPLCQCMAKIPS